MSAVPALRLRSARNALAAGLVGLLLVVLTVPFAGPPIGGSDDLRRAATTVLDDRALVRSSGWRSVSSAKAYLRTLTKSTKKGATLTSPTSTTAGGSVRLQFGPGRGKVGIWVGGVKVRSVRTARDTRKLVTVTFGGSGGVVLKVARPRNGVYVDKLTVSSPPTPPIVPRSPAASEIVVTEVMAQPNGVTDAEGEWFELTSVADVPLQLAGCSVTNGTSSTTLPAITLPAHGVALLARNSDATANGGLPTVTALFNFALTDVASHVGLSCGTLIDQTADLNAVLGTSTWLPANHTTSVDNDTASTFCTGGAIYGTPGNANRGTPGALNPLCFS